MNAWLVRVGVQLEAIRLRRFNFAVKEMPTLCAAAARGRVERAWCRKVCSRYNLDSVRSVVLEFM